MGYIRGGYTLVLAVLLAYMCGQNVDGMRVSGFVDSDNHWVYIANFCYDKTGSGADDHGKFSPKASTNHLNQSLALYTDTDYSWGVVHDLPCEERLVHYEDSKGPAIETWDLHVSDDEEDYEEINIRDNSRPRFWYVSGISCPGRTQFDFDLHFTNPQNGWEEEFSCQEQGLLPMYLFFFFLWIAGIGAHLYGLWQLRRTSSLHTIIKLFSTSALMMGTAIFLFLIHYSVYSSNGYGLGGIKGLAIVLDAASILCFMILLIVLAKGWTISKPVLDDKKKLAWLIALYVFAYFALFVWMVAERAKSSNTYIYESAPGIIIVLLRMITMLWFGWCIVNTINMEQDPEKVAFYKRIAIVFAIWFATVPLIVGIASALDSWVREKVVTSIHLVITTFAYSIMGYLLWPTKVSRYFQIAPPDVLSASTPYDEL